MTRASKPNISLFQVRLDFTKKYLPPAKGYRWRLLGDGERGPVDEPSTSCFGTSVGHFMDAGLSLPMDPLFLEFMNMTGIPFNKINLNTVRTIAAISILNKRYNVSLGIREILYCEKVMTTPGGETFYFFPYTRAPELVRYLPTCQKAVIRKNLAVVAGPIVPEGYENFEFPRANSQQGRPSANFFQKQPS
jgi:hypothetical protein